MTKQNPFITKLPETYTVSYYDEQEWDKDLTPEELEQREIINSYHNQLLASEKGSGPCQNSSCDCYCSAYECICNDYTGYGHDGQNSKREIKIDKNKSIVGFQHLIHTGNDWADRNNCPVETRRDELWNERGGHDSSDGEFSLHSYRTSAGANRGIGGVIASGGGEYSLFKINSPDGSSSSEGIRFLGLSAGGEVGAGPGGATLGYTANADLVNVQVGGFRANVGGDIGSGVAIGAGGVEAKVAGFGLSVGKKMGISTPFGGVSFDLEEGCSTQ